MKKSKPLYFTSPGNDLQGRKPLHLKRNVRAAHAVARRYMSVLDGHDSGCCGVPLLRLQRATQLDHRCRSGYRVSYHRSRCWRHLLPCGCEHSDERRARMMNKEESKVGG